MTKDSRPSRLCDIRLFAGHEHKYLEGHEEVVAFARRLAWYLNGEGFSIGAHTHMYVFFSPSTPVGEAKPTDYGGDWWQRYTHVAAPRQLTKTPGTDEKLRAGIVEALKANRPDQEGLIESAAATVMKHGANLRFLMQQKLTKSYKSEVTFSIGSWGREPTYVQVFRTDCSSNALMASPRIDTLSAEEAFSHKAMALAIPVMEYAPIAAKPPISKQVKQNG